MNVYALKTVVEVRGNSRLTFVPGEMFETDDAENLVKQGAAETEEMRKARFERMDRLSDAPDDPIPDPIPEA